jgi:hypothetical protein
VVLCFLEQVHEIFKQVRKYIERMLSRSVEV